VATFSPKWPRASGVLILFRLLTGAPTSWAHIEDYFALAIATVALRERVVFVGVVPRSLAIRACRIDIRTSTMANAAGA
jgi:hypothetical protein